MSSVGYISWRGRGRVGVSLMADMDHACGEMLVFDGCGGGSREKTSCPLHSFLQEYVKIFAQNGREANFWIVLDSAGVVSGEHRVMIDSR